MIDPLHPIQPSSSQQKKSIDMVQSQTRKDDAKAQDAFLAELFGSNASRSNPDPLMAKAPLVGAHHKQTQSLVGFDPLLTSTPPSSGSKIVNLNHPTSAPVNIDSASITIQNPFDMVPSIPPLNEAQTPPPRSSKRLPFMKKREHCKTKSLSGPLTLAAAATIPPVKPSGSGGSSNENSPLPPTSRKATGEAPKPAPSTPRGGMFSPWSRKGHRKTRSISSTSPTPPQQSPKNTEPQTTAVSAQNSPQIPSDKITSMSPMIQELLKVEQEAGIQTQAAQPSLFVPSLSKPQPTSFLTGQEEVVRSSEQDPTSWQLEIPGHSDALTSMRLCEFMDTYRSEECLLDLHSLVGLDRMRLSSFARGDSKLFSGDGTEIADCHRSIVESLLECGNDISEVKGFFTSNAHGKPDQRREVLVLERQNKFLCIFRGTTPEQQGKNWKQSETCEIKAGPSAQVFVDRYSAFAEFQSLTFQLLDKLSEDHPFCDIAFTGHMFGASMATIAAYMYANTRTSLRVSCMVSAPSKVGLADFRLAAHSTPNLNMCRIEIGKRSSPQHVGHCLRLTPATNNRLPVVQLLKFGGSNNNQEQAHALMGRLPKPKEKDVHEYVTLLEDLLNARTWVRDYYKEDGAGVRGKDNEARQMA